jgi:two-component system cell cycle response regulator CpdR
MAAPRTILLVEGDEDVRDVTAAILDAEGFRVLVAQSGDEAVQLLGQEQVNVLFTDIVMPGINGIELARRAERLYPNLKFMFMTGYHSCFAGAGQGGAEAVSGVRNHGDAGRSVGRRINRVPPTLELNPRGRAGLH